MQLLTVKNELKQSIPNISDPRWPVAVMLAIYLILGITVLGFNRNPTTVLAVISFAAILDMILNFLLRGKKMFFPLSGVITGMSLSILLNYSHGSWLILLPIFIAISSKYLLTVKGRHIYNPALFAIICSLLFSSDLIAPSPAYQWGETWTISMFIATAAVMLFVLKIKRTALIVSFLASYLVMTLIRAYILKWHIPPEVILMGALSSPAFYLFTFFMLTDPKTSPDGKKAQIIIGFFIAFIDLLLHKLMLLNTHFFAAFTVQTCFIISRIYRLPKDALRMLFTNVKYFSKKLIVISVGFVLSFLVVSRPMNNINLDPNFRLAPILSSHSGLKGAKGDVLHKIDPKVAHIAKWFLSIGDAVAIADFDNDGLQDIFLTNSLKAQGDRAALYRNIGNLRFERIAISDINYFVRSPEKYGLPSDAIWFDYDNDRDKDLLIIVGYGAPILLHNNFIETGKIDFVNVTKDAGLSHFYLTSITANVADINQDGYLDIIIGNSSSPYLLDYGEKVPFNIFKLPEPEFDGDRRMFNFMHRNWYNAVNGGENILLLGGKNRKFDHQDIKQWGLGGTYWTMDVGTGDLNNDGFTDLYMANDFGPDRLFLNKNGTEFKSIMGTVATSIGRDTYKGMNASIGDVDGNGFADIYVSNVHEPLQSEGSMLWMNSGKPGAASFVDKAWQSGALNPNRFGWGGAMGDIDLDGDLDILQANGHIDDAYDETDGTCADYWYWNDKIALTSPDIHGYADQWADLRGRCIFPYERDRIYINVDGNFIDVAEKVGWKEKNNSRGIGVADFDNDGDLDVLVSHQTAAPSLWRNDNLSASSWLGIDLIGNGVTCNNDALGTRVDIKLANGNKQWREKSASNGLSAQGDSRIVFGFGEDSTSSDNIEVVITWCGRETQNIALKANQYHKIKQKN